MVATSIDQQQSNGQAKTGQLVQKLATGLRELSEQFHLDPAKVSAHRDRIENLLLSATSSNLPSPAKPDSPWGWQPSLEQPDLSVGTLTVWDGTSIPLHDHPGSTGLLLVLDGKIRVRSYRISDGQAADRPPLELELTGDETLGRGDHCMFGPSKNNIHSLHAVDGDCRIFDVLFSPYALQQRSFFMPIVPASCADTIYVTRLVKLHKRSIH